MKTPLLRTLLAGASLATLVTPSLHAAVLVNYSFTGGSAAPTTQDPDVTGSNAAWVGMANSGFSSSTGTAFVRADSVPASFSSGQYFEFTITADPGFTLSLDTLDFRMGGQNTAAATYTVNANVRSSVGGFASDLTINPGTVTTASHTIANANTTSYSDFSVDLSGAAFDNLTTLTLRIYPSDDSVSNSKFYRYDTVTLNGTVTAIPEPTAVTLLTVSLVGLLAFRRLPFQTRFAK